MRMIVRVAAVSYSVHYISGRNVPWTRPSCRKRIVHVCTHVFPCYRVHTCGEKSREETMCISISGFSIWIRWMTVRIKGNIALADAAGQKALLYSLLAASSSSPLLLRFRVARPIVVFFRLVNVQYLRRSTVLKGTYANAPEYPQEFCLPTLGNRPETPATVLGFLTRDISSWWDAWILFGKWYWGSSLIRGTIGKGTVSRVQINKKCKVEWFPRCSIFWKTEFENSWYFCGSILFFIRSWSILPFSLIRISEVALKMLHVFFHWNKRPCRIL